MIKKDLIIAILGTFCLTSALFMIMPTRSSPGTKEYDPWLDYNEDGKISLSDLVSLAQDYGATGDPIKNVNVTNFPLDEQGNLKVSIGDQTSSTIKKGLQKIVVLDTFSYGTNGICLAKPGLASTNSYFWFLFEPKSKFLNVTEIYINIIWRAEASGTALQPHSLYLIFQNVTDPANFEIFKLGPGIFPSTEARNSDFQISKDEPTFNFNYVYEGMNHIEISRSDSYGDWVFIYKLELFIEYNYLG